MTASKSSLIIGGGVIGLNIALQLQAEGGQVTLCDIGSETSASYGNAGHIATEQVEPLASMATVNSAWRRWFMRGGALSLPPQGFFAWLPFSLRLLAAAQPKRFAQGKAVMRDLLSSAMPAWKRRVADIGAPDLLCEDGHFVVWETPESAAKGLKSWSSSDTGTASLRPVSDEEMTQLKALARTPIHGAIRFSGTAQIADTRRMLETLKERFIERGGRYLHDRVEKLITRPNDGKRSAWVVLSGGEQLTADTLIVAAGIASKALLEGLGETVPMIAERGYHIQTPDHGWPKGFPPVVFEDRSMIVTGFEHGLRAASFVEFNRVDAAPDRRKWARLRCHVADLGLPFEGAGNEWIGVRPTLPDYLPAIGRSRRADNLFYAFGHQHLGLTLGAVTGDIVADMIRSGYAPAAFDLSRFN